MVWPLRSSRLWETPRPSLPMITAHRPRPACSSETVSARRAVAYSGRPDRSNSAHSSSGPASHTGSRKQAPIEARTVLGPYGSAQPFTSRRPSAPRASAVRQMVPTFPGSCTPSSTRYRRPSSRSGRVVSGRRARNSAPWGVFIGEMVSITSWGTWMARTPWGSSGTCAPSVTTTVVSGASQHSASSSSLTPSPRYSPASRRALALPEDSFLIFIKSGFFRLVIRSIITAPVARFLWEPNCRVGPDHPPAFDFCAEKHTNRNNFHWYAFPNRQSKGLMLEISRFIAFKSNLSPDLSKLNTAWRRQGSGHPPSAGSGPHGRPPHVRRRLAFPPRRCPSSCGAAG